MDPLGTLYKSSSYGYGMGAGGWPTGMRMRYRSTSTSSEDTGLLDALYRAKPRSQKKIKHLL